MASLLRELEVLVVDCQTSGATPAHGDVLELAWASTGHAGVVGDVHGTWVVPHTERRISAAVRELTGWSEGCLSEAVEEQEAWRALHEHALALAARATSERVPTVIHFARFELHFLRDWHARLAPSQAFPFDVVCLHAVAARLFPDLSRKSIRALSGYLGHAPTLVRRAVGHVEASAFIWQAVVPQLEELGVGSWDALCTWLAEPAQVVRSARRTYPLAQERRRALPDRPGVYRFIRRNGDVLYVGKATSLKKRVAGHFRSGGKPTERSLELLTQVHDIRYAQTDSILEAALLESDEIKALDPPYNVQLRSQERSAWFAARTLDDATPAPDAAHTLGPLPSRRAVSALVALSTLAAGAEATPLLRAVALAVPVRFLPPDELFTEGFRGFARELRRRGELTPARSVEHSALALWLERRRSEPERTEEDDPTPPDGWDLARVRRRLDRNLIQAGLLLRRARFLCLLADADVAFRERDMSGARALSWSLGELLARHDLPDVASLAQLPVRRMRALSERKGSFDAARYDRLRVLATELARVHTSGGEVAVRFAAHVVSGERLARIMRSI